MMGVKAARSRAGWGFAKSADEWAEGGVEREAGRSRAAEGRDCGCCDGGGSGGGSGGGTESRGRCNSESDDDDDVSSAKLGRVRGEKWFWSGCGCLRGCHSLPIMAGRGYMRWHWRVSGGGGKDKRLAGRQADRGREALGRTKSTVSRESQKGLGFE